MSRLVELSHEIHDGMITFPGLPGPEITVHLSREGSRALYGPNTEFHIGRISMVANTGTYLDVPFHRLPDGADLSEFPLTAMADLDCVVIRPNDVEGRAIDHTVLAPYRISGRAVLVHTGWDRHWGTETYGGGEYPYLTADAAAWLLEHGAVLVGIDSVNVDDTHDGSRPVHTTLLSAGIPIVEHLTGLNQLPPEGFRFHAAPPRVRGMGTFPVGAYAVLAAAPSAPDIPR